MTIGLLHMQFLIPGARSLKDKRRGMNSLKTAYTWMPKLEEVIHFPPRTILRNSKTTQSNAYKEGTLDHGQ